MSLLLRRVNISLMIILGIDPGTARTGYGVLNRVGKGTSETDYKVIDFGCITTSSKQNPERRVETIFDELERVVKKYRVDIVTLEALFFNTNAKTAMMVGRASGIVLLLAARYNLPLVEYTPLQVKIAVAGYGRADKKQMQEMVKTLLGLKEIPKPDDSADALAVALCHGLSSRG